MIRDANSRRMVFFVEVSLVRWHGALMLLFTIVKSLRERLLLPSRSLQYSASVSCRLVTHGSESAICSRVNNAMLIPQTLLL